MRNQDGTFIPAAPPQDRNFTMDDLREGAKFVSAMFAENGAFSVSDDAAEWELARRRLWILADMVASIYNLTADDEMREAVKRALSSGTRLEDLPAHMQRIYAKHSVNAG